VKVRVRVPGKRPGTTKWGSVNGVRIRTPQEKVIKFEKDEKYKQRLNFDFTKKRHYGRFTKNPRAPRDFVIVEENPISNVRYKGDLVSHVRQLLLGKDK
jgi:hypothetical protein